jgi:hypothetical protein
MHPGHNDASVSYRCCLACTGHEGDFGACADGADGGDAGRRREGAQATRGVSAGPRQRGYGMDFVCRTESSGGGGGCDGDDDEDEGG